MLQHSHCFHCYQCSFLLQASEDLHAQKRTKNTLCKVLLPFVFTCRLQASFRSHHNFRMPRQPRRQPPLRFLLREGEGLPSSDAGSTVNAAQRAAAALYGRSSNAAPSSSIQPSQDEEMMDRISDQGPGETEDDNDEEDPQTPRRRHNRPSFALVDAMAEIERLKVSLDTAHNWNAVLQRDLAESNKERDALRELVAELTRDPSQAPTLMRQWTPSSSAASAQHSIAESEPSAAGPPVSPSLAPQQDEPPPSPPPRKPPPSLTRALPLWHPNPPTGSSMSSFWRRVPSSTGPASSCGSSTQRPSSF
jgi:hypothetical protein